MTFKWTIKFVIIFFLPNQVKSEMENISCRIEAGLTLPFNEYRLDTCARCYNYLPNWAFTNRLKYLKNGMFLELRTNRIYFSNQTQIISSTFLIPSMIHKWQQCCEEAVNCCVKFIKNDYKNKNKNVCPKTWDGWSCWFENAPLGSIVEKPCPNHIYWNEYRRPPCMGYVTKNCTEKGTWLKRGSHEWSDYTKCAREDLYIRRNYFLITTHVISIVFMVPALVIFITFRQLYRINRIKIHIHLLASLLLYSLLRIFLTKEMIKSLTEIEEESKPILSNSGTIETYEKSTTYFWMFNEAIYLYQLITRAFFKPYFKPLVIIAYGIPFLTTLIYLIVRATFLEMKNTESNLDLLIPWHSDSCWRLPSKLVWQEWLMNAPNLAILIINCILLTLILKEIYAKSVACIPSRNSNTGDVYNLSPHPYHQAYMTNKSQLFRKTSFLVSLRAASLLLPLYGLHYLLIIYRPNVKICLLSQLYHYSSITLDGFQGTLVSILYCFTNNEVKSHIKRVVNKRSDRTNYLTEIVQTFH